MKIHLKRLSGILLFLVMVLCIVETVYSTTHHHLQHLMNPPANGEPHQWLGADAATSIHIQGDRYIWLFGDTIIGTSYFPLRYPLSALKGGFVHNSVGVTQCYRGRCAAIQKFFRPGSKAIFSPANSHQYYWVLSGAMVEGKLFLTVCRLGSGSPIAILGTTFLLVTNPEDSPSQWHVEKTWDVPGTNAQLNWFTAVVRYHHYLYLFGERGSGFSAQTIISRMTVDAAAKQQWSQRQYYAGGTWSTAAKPEALQGLPGTAEMSIIHRRNSWYALQIAPLSYTVVSYSASSLMGPWAKQAVVYTVPKPWSTEMTEKDHTFTVYAPKLHPEMSRHGELVFTYNTNVNSLVLGAQKANAIFYHDIWQARYQGLYIPQFVVIALSP